MKKMGEHFEDEIKGFREYHSLAVEYKGTDLEQDFNDMAKDELKHAKFWLDLLYYSEEFNEEYVKEYQEGEELLTEGGVETW